MLHTTHNFLMAICLNSHLFTQPANEMKNRATARKTKKVLLKVYFRILSARELLSFVSKVFERASPDQVYGHSNKLFGQKLY